MDKIIQDLMTNGLNIEAIFQLVMLMIVFFVILYIKDLMERYSAYKSFCNNKTIGIGSWVRIPTSSGYIDGKVKEVDIKYIIIECKEVKIMVSIKSFTTRDWSIVRIDKVPQKEINTNECRKIVNGDYNS